jgi:hypothetical protein
MAERKTCLASIAHGWITVVMKFNDPLWAAVESLLDSGRLPVAAQRVIM